MPEPVSISVPQEVVNDTTVRVIRVVIAHGQPVSAGQAVVELETSKSNLEVESPAAGWLELLCKAGDDLPIGGLIGRVHAAFEDMHATAVAQAPIATAIDEEDTGGSTHAPVFSHAARQLIARRGLDESQFAARAFVRATDVEAFGGDSRESDVTATTDVAPDAGSTAMEFHQTLAEHWCLLDLIRADLHRIDGRHDLAEFLRQWWWNPSFSYVLWFRVAQWARAVPWAKLLVYPLALMALQHRHLQSGIRIPISVKAGPGLLVAHWGSIWVNPASTLGANCTLANDINMGSAGSGGKPGVPQVGDDVYVGPGARLAGAIKIGRGVAIMANTLVTADVPPGSVVIGVPHRITAQKDRNTFVSHTDYPLP